MRWVEKRFRLSNPTRTTSRIDSFIRVDVPLGLLRRKKMCRKNVSDCVPLGLLRRK